MIPANSPASDPPRVLVIGYGNTLRGDDGLGRRAAEALARRPLPAGVEVLTCHQLTVELAETISRADLVLLIDAANGDQPGTIVCEPVDRVDAPVGPILHYLEPPALLACVEALYNAAPRTLLWTITARSFDYAETLSPEVERALPALLRQVEACIESAIRACD